MARPRTYDPEAVLDEALKVFWSRGYEQTSIQDLVDATGVQRYGLYESFGDKHALFLSALRRYKEVWVGGILGDLLDEEASVAEVLAFFERLEVIAPADVAPAGCFLCNSAAELGGHDEDVDRIVCDYMDLLHASFERALRNARERGELSEAIDPESHARYLAGVVLGVSLHKRTPAGEAALRTFVDTALGPLRAAAH